MPKIHAILLLIIILVQLASSQSGIYSDLYKYNKQSIVVIHANNSQNKPICQGTGFFINEAGYIITNFHIINGSSKVNVTTTNGQSYPVTSILARDISSDLVYLSVDIPSQFVRPIRLNITPPEVGEEILVIGYPESPGRLAQSMTRGIVSSVQTLSEYGEVIQFDAAVSPGASGSPLINMKCEAVGIATFGYMNGQNQNFAVSCRQILELIHKASSAQDGTSIYDWNLTSDEKLYAIGLDLYRMGEYNQSIYYFKEAIKLNSNYTDSWHKMGNDFFNLGRYYDALQAFNKTIELNPEDSFAWIDIGITFKLLNKNEEAFKAYDKAIDLNPQNAFPWICKGDNLAANGQYSEAIEAYDKAIEMKPKGLQGSIVWNQKGDALRAQRKYEEALQAYNKSIELDSHLSNSRMSKSAILEVLG